MYFEFQPQIFYRQPQVTNWEINLTQMNVFEIRVEELKNALQMKMIIFIDMIAFDKH